MTGQPVDNESDIEDSGPDIEDEIDASRAPLLVHLTELRKRLIWCAGAFFFASLACFFFAEHLYNWLLVPYLKALGPDAGGLIYTGPLEFFFAQLKISLFAGLFFAFPVIAWQLYAFVAPGLYRNESSALLPFLIAAPLLFVAGGLFVFHVVFPMVMSFALGFEQSGDGGQARIDARIRVAEYLSLIMALMLAFGLSFQLPVVLGLLGKAGLVNASSLRTGRKYAVVGILAVAACFTPPDVISQIMLAVPVYGLYEISIRVVAALEREVRPEKTPADSD